MSTIFEIAVKTIAGGLLVLGFAALAQTLSPKRFAGILSAAPSVALAGLTVTALFSGPDDVAVSLPAMGVGAVAFVAYCAGVIPLTRRFGVWRGSLGALVLWGVLAGGGYLAVWS
ncbi:MAG TPA: hypothetical protein VGF84_01675 [Micromonosporaceae bacterium]|jgi:uncharacterized membrane protein (GlpM family)